MNTLRFAKGCRVTGKFVLICAVIFVVGDFIELHIERSHRPPNFDPEADMARIVTCYLCTLGAGVFGCFLLWLSSFLGPKNPADLI